MEKSEATNAVEDVTVESQETIAAEETKSDNISEEKVINNKDSAVSEEKVMNNKDSAVSEEKVINNKDSACQKKSGYAAIKKEFLAPEHKPTLSAEYLSPEMKSKMGVAGKVEAAKEKTNEEVESENSVPLDESNEGEPPSKKAKLKGRNKHRPKTAKIEAKDRLCPAIKQERTCNFGDRCKFSHDKADFISKKLPDLEEPCHVYKTFGYCKFGISCRFAKSHLTEDYQNMKDEELYAKMKDVRSLNEMSDEVRKKLWKKKYDFKRADAVVKEIQEKFRGVKDPDQEQDCSNGVANVPSGTGNADTNGISCETRTERPSGCITDEEIIRVRPEEKKKIDFANKLYLAPLTTVGNLPFRRICKELGADITCGEMALTTQLLKATYSECSLIKRHPSEDIFGVQVCGSYPDTMTRCAQLLTETCNVDFIDINCGCPIELIYKKGGGSALMGKVTKLEQICRSMIGVMGDTPLTVKVRTGVFDNKSVAHAIAPRLRDAGVSLLTIHGRSREQRYTRMADWDYIYKVAEAGAPMPVFGNGDILSWEDANLHMQTHGVKGVMLARGALIKPWLFTEIKEQRHWDISSGERLDILRRYANYGLEHWGSDRQGVENTRRFLLEWISFLHRYIPVGVLERVPQKINERPPYYVGRDDLETMMASANCADWIKISEMLLGPVPPNFLFLPKHKANAYQ